MPPQDRRVDDLTLAPLDALGDPAELRAEVAQHLATAAANVPYVRHYEVADSSGSIWVSVDTRGKVESIDIRRGWRDLIAVSEFADALFDAYTGAVRRALDEAALMRFAAEQAAMRPGQRSDDRQARPGPAWTDPNLDDREWLAATWDVLDGIDAELRRVTDLDTGRAGDERELIVSSPHGYLALRVRGRGLVGITGDVRRIAEADIAQLRLDALAAFRAVHLTRES